MLLNEEEIENILKKTLPNVAEEDIHRAAQSIVNETGKWQEVSLGENLGATYSVQCKDICAIGKAFEDGSRIRAFIVQE